MAEYLNNETRDLIYHFLDGEADVAQQKVLFDSLAEDEELQSEFNQAVELNNALSFDKMNLAPSAALTDNLFKKVGFSVGGATVSAPIEPIAATWTAMFLSRVSSLINRYATGTAAALVSASIIFSVYNIVETGLNKTDKNEDNTIVNSIVSSNTNTYKQNNYPVSSSIESQTKAVAKTKKSNNVFNNNIFNNNDNNEFVNSLNTTKSNSTKQSGALNNNNDLNANEDALDNRLTSNTLASNNLETESALQDNKISQFETMRIEHSKVNSNIDNKLNSMQTFGGFSINPLSMEFDNTENLNLSIELGGVSALNYYPNRTVDESGAGLNNMNIAIKYNFNNNHSLGLVGGKESLQMYEIEKNKKKYIFNKETSILWAGINYKYSLDKIESLYYVQPYSEITFGGTKYGPVSKGVLGVSYNMFSNFNLSLGFEWTTLVYSELNSIKATHKSGIVYKLSYNF